MGQLVRLQMTFRYELLPTLITLEGPLSSVRTHVSFEVPSLLELLEAELEGADEQFDLVLGPLHLFDVSS